MSTDAFLTTTGCLSSASCTSIRTPPAERWNRVSISRSEGTRA
jgi:hypothetical protein